MKPDSQLRAATVADSHTAPRPPKLRLWVLPVLLSLASCGTTNDVQPSTGQSGSYNDASGGAPTSGGTAGSSSESPSIGGSAVDASIGGSGNSSGTGAVAGALGADLTLRQAADLSGRWVGAALGSYFFKDTNYTTIAAREFNYLTPENEMKWTATEPNPNEFSFAGGDALVAFAEQNQMRVKGHCLVWYYQLPGWVDGLGTPEEVREVMTRHIQQVAGHFRGKLAAWDVVNEAIDDGDEHGLRDSVFYRQLGETYIDEAFYAARAADPDALLFYNDYGTEGLGGKSDAVYKLVKRLVEARVPIDGVGLQMHINGTGSPSVDEILSNMRRITELGLLVNISELDVNLCGVPGDQAAKFEVQRQRYREIVAACMATPKCHAITLWGITDKYSWLEYFSPCGSETDGSPWGLPWDKEYVPKPARQGIMDALLSPLP